MNHTPAAGEARAASRVVAVAALGALAVALFVAPPFHGPILFVVSPGHGFDLGDGAAFGVAVVAARLARPLLRPVRPRLGAVARSDTALAGLGVALAITGLLDRSGVAGDLGGSYDLAAPLVLAVLVAWTITAAVLDPVPWPATVAATVAAPAAALGAGLLLDAAVNPSGTLFGPAAAAAVLAARALRPTGRALFGVMVVVMLAVNVASLADIAGIDVAMSRSDGGTARDVALAAVVLAGSALELADRRRDAPTRGGP